jgi:hypothetical protein
MLLGDSSSHWHEWRRLSDQERCVLLALALYIRNNPESTEAPIRGVFDYSGMHKEDFKDGLRLLERLGLVEISKDPTKKDGKSLSFSGRAMSSLLMGENLLQSVERRHGRLEEEPLGNFVRADR